MGIQCRIVVFAITLSACSGEDKGVATGTIGDASTGASGGTTGTGATSGTGAAGSTGATGGIGGSGCPEPPVSGCDNSPQCGCPGQNCVFAEANDGTTTCVDAGNTPPYHSCAMTAGECVAGTVCGGGLCRPYCVSNADCPGANRACVPLAGFPDLEGTSVCTAGCDLVTPDVCGPGAGCIVGDSGGTQILDCWPVGTNMGPGGCTSADQNSCAPGYVCLGDSECRKWCRVGFPTDCPSGTCAGLGVFVGPTEYGHCP